MSMIEVIRDESNPLLSRREITCTFKGLSGRLKKLEAAEIISKQFSLEGKIVVPILLKNETGKPVVSATFYVYDDERLAKEHLKDAIFKRLEKAKGAPTKSKEVQEDIAKTDEPKPESKPKIENKPKGESK